MVSCKRDLSAAKRELSEHANTRDRRGTLFWVNDGSPRHGNAHFLTTGKIVLCLLSRSSLLPYLENTSGLGS